MSLGCTAPSHEPNGLWSAQDYQGSFQYRYGDSPSGVDFLDDEAANAMRNAGPFPNPPEGLVDPGSHLITFRFGFMFEVGSAPRIRVYRN